jgi:hypothetical protein
VGDLLKRLGLVVDAELEDLDTLEQGIDAWTRSMGAAEDKAGVLTQAVGKLDSGLKDYAKQAADVRDRSEKIALMWNILMERGVSSAQATKILATELAQLQTKAKGLADSDLPAVTTKLLQLGKGVDDAGNKFFKLQLSGQYIEGVNRGVNMLLGSMGKINPQMAEFAQGAQQISMGGAAAAKSLADWGKASTGMEKGAALAGGAMAGMAVAIQLADMWIAKIDRDTRAYVEGSLAASSIAVSRTAEGQNKIAAALEGGWKGFDRAKTSAENYTGALAYLREKGILGLKTGEAEAKIATEGLEQALKDLGITTGREVATETATLSKALDGLTRSEGYAEEEAVARLMPAFQQLAKNSANLTERELPAQTVALLELAKTYGMIGDAAKDSAAVQLTATQTAIGAIREKLIPANQALLDVMTQLEGQEEATSLAQAENILWTQEQAKAHVLAAEAAGEYVPYTERLAAGLTESVDAMEREGKAAEDATVSKLELGEAEDSLADSADDVTESMDRSSEAMESGMDKDFESAFGTESERSFEDDFKAMFGGEGSQSSGLGGDPQRQAEEKERYRDDPGFRDLGGTGFAVYSGEVPEATSPGAAGAGAVQPITAGSSAGPGRGVGRAAGGFSENQTSSRIKGNMYTFGQDIPVSQRGRFSTGATGVESAWANAGPTLLAGGSLGGGAVDGADDGVYIGKGQGSPGERTGGGGGDGGGGGPVASQMLAGLSADQIASSEQTQGLIPSVVTEGDIGLAGSNARAGQAYAHNQGLGEAAGQVSTEAVGMYLRLEKIAELLEPTNPQ